MTYDQWVATERTHNDLSVADTAFGYVPDGAVEVVEYSPGVMVRLKDGKYFTHVGRSEYTGELDVVRRRMWDEYAEIETRVR